jgi:hypothetical protein
VKKLLVVMILAITFSAQAQSSLYHPFPDSGIVWLEHESGVGLGCCCFGYPCVHSGDHTYFQSGDTVISSITYRKLFRSGNSVDYIAGASSCPSGCTNYDPYYYFNEYWGALRQDTSQRRIYYVPPYNTQEMLLYDFNLALGDTLPEAYNNSPSTNYVSAIDSVLIGSEYHKQFWLSYGYSDYVSIIEGIGSTFGLLYQLSPPFEFYNLLLCVTMDSITVFPDSTVACQLFNSVDQIEDPSLISLYPNPFHTDATLIVNASFVHSELTIFNLLGKQVKIQEINSSTLTINRDGLADGIYFFKAVNTNGHGIGGRMIVQ